ncbi:MAG: hypothetical protein J6K82_00940 [Alphaproteobacteria bacterium]|nr:hypothetical protein [Alphaproteobacteria bacterium]
MRKFIHFITAFFICVGVADAAVRDANTISRTASNTKTTISRQPTNTTGARNTKNRVVSRTTNAKQSATRTATTPARTARTANTIARSAAKIQHSRAATNQTAPRNATTISRAATTPARATLTLNATQSNTFGTGYNTCRDAYFTCMDQFCATANDAYRRCICSSKLSEIQSRERALGQASDQLADFKNLNLAVIDKTATEVNAMLSASIGEIAQSEAKDTSASALQLAGISDVLSKTKNKSLSTQGTLDIAGDINEIWAKTDLAGGTNISTLVGEALYNAVHAQCSEIVSDKCTSDTTKSMVTSAYGMYIENDCALLISGLDKKLTSANSTIRDTEREMNAARVENYNAHNSTSINDCIAQVRLDITSDVACGADYVHCLDLTGRYLKYETGEPIYTPDFYQLEYQVSLSGDVLTNQTNRLLVQLLNNKRMFAARGLDTCRDIADEVWDEFMRQAISEIYQGQQERIRTVKNECLDVVNKCYDEKTQSLKDFSNIDEKLLLGGRLELSEQMCQEKLNTCSNLYGGGTQGMSELLTAMRDITTQTIGQQCLTILQDFAKKQCTVPGNDTQHAYPYGCRIYAPGEQIYATNMMCNLSTKTEIHTSYGPSTITLGDGYSTNQHKFTECGNGYFMAYEGVSNTIPKTGNQCLSNDTNNTVSCGVDYIGSLYHKIVRYAMQNCVRPSETNKELPPTVMQDISIVMNEIRDTMSTELNKECQRLGGIWVENSWIDNQETPNGTFCQGGVPCTDTIYITDGLHDITGHTLYEYFYKETAANPKWGYCITPEQVNETTYTLSFINSGAECTPSPTSHDIKIKYGAMLPDIIVPTCTLTSTGENDTTTKEYKFQGYYLDGTKYYDENGKPTITNYNIKGNQALSAKWDTQ